MFRNENNSIMDQLRWKDDIVQNTTNSKHLLRQAVRPGAHSEIRGGRLKIDQNVENE